MTSADELQRICADRPPTPEFPFVNGFYGHGAILRRYADVAPEVPIPAVIPHSVDPNPGYLWTGEAKAGVAAVLSYPPYRDAAFAAAGSHVLPSASPFLYAMELPDTTPTSRSGTAYFPSHSTHVITVESEGQVTAEWLAGLPEPYAPVTVVLYWRDVQLGRDVPFRQAGLPVTSAGHMYDPRFLLRLRDILLRSRFAAGSRFGAHAVLAVGAGCLYLELPGQPESPLTPIEQPTGTAEPNVLRVDPPNDRAPAWLRIRDAFLNRDPDRQQQVAVADYLLGTDRLLRADDLRTLLLDELPEIDRRTSRVPFAVRRRADQLRRSLALRTRVRRLLFGRSGP